jgi:hypothetical protein
MTVEELAMNWWMLAGGLMALICTAGHAFAGWSMFYDQSVRRSPTIFMLESSAACGCVYRELKLGRSGDEVRLGCQVT